MKHFNQIITCFFSCFPIFFMGLTIGYSTIYLHKQQESDNIKDKDAVTSGLVGGSGLMLSCLGSLVGGFIIDSLGRKWSIYSTFLLNVVGWLILAATEYFLIGRLLLSFSIGIAFFSPVYTSEILQPDLRGQFGILACVFEIAGNECVYVLQFYLSQQLSAYILSLFALILFGITFFVPESPYWYLMKGRRDAAIQSLRWLRNGDEHATVTELEQMSESFNAEAPKSNFKNVITSGKAWKFFGKLSVYVLLFETTGFDMIIPYSVQFFEEINQTGFDNRFLTMIFAAIGLIGTIVSMFFVEKMSRIKCVSLANLINIVFLSLVVIRETFLKSPNYSVISIIGIMGYCPFVSLSCFIFPWIIISESLPTDMRGIIYAALAAEFYIIFYVIVQVFPFILFYTPINVIILSFIMSSILNIIFVNLFIHDTRGKIMKSS